LQRCRKAQIVRFIPDVNEAQAGLLARQAKANPDIGPAAMDGFGGAAVIRGEPAGLSAIPEHLILALPSARPWLASHPSEVGPHDRIHRRS
jgi:hypothetical protein